MSAVPIPIPSQLSEDSSEWVRSFATQLRDEVAVPLFSVPDAAGFGEALPDSLVRGAILRARWLAKLKELPVEQATELSNAWMRPPPPSVLSELQRCASALLGAERSFQLQRAFALTLTDGVEGAAAVIERWRAGDDNGQYLADLARLAEVVAPQDVLALAWMMVLLGDVPEPTGEVADAAASTLLQLTVRRLRALSEVVNTERSPRSVEIDDARLPVDWLRGHPALVSPLLVLIGLACDDASSVKVELAVAPDPEEALSFVVLRVHVRGDPDEALERLEERALRAGVLGVLSDRCGGMIALSSQAATA